MRLLSIIPWVFLISHTQSALADARLGFQVEGGILQFSGPGYYDRMGEAEIFMGTTLSETTSIDLTMGAISFHNSDDSQLTKTESEGYTIGTRFTYHPGRFQTWLGVAAGAGTDYLYEDGYLTGQASSYSLVRYDLGVQGNLYHSKSFKLGLFARAKHLEIGSRMIRNNEDLVLAYGLNLTFQIEPGRHSQHRYDYHHHHIDIYPSSRFLYYVARGAAEIFPRILLAIIKS